MDTVCECTLSASPHTPWHLQDGVNDLHKVYRRVSAVRGAGEVRKRVLSLSSSLYEMSAGYVMGSLGTQIANSAYLVRFCDSACARC